MASFGRLWRKTRWIGPAVLLMAVAGCAMYTKGRPIQTGLPPKSALLVIDIQNDFVEPGGRLPVDKVQADRVIQNANRLITAFTLRDRHVVYIGNEFSPSDRIANWFRNGAAIQGTEGVKLSKRLKIAGKKIYFSKSQSDAFSNASLDAHLRKQGITKLYLVGVFAEHCVLATARGALQRGYSVVTVTDSIASKNDKALAAAIKKHQKAGVNVLKTEEALAKLKAK